MLITKQNITAVILAGGKGRRLEGQDKGLVTFKGKPLIEHVLERITPQTDSVIINANRNIETYEGYGHLVINDDLSDFQGPLAGFASAMRVVKTSHIITLPCDGPNLPPDLVSRMLATLDNQVDTIAIAHDGKRLQPVHALIPISLIYSLEMFLDAGDRKIDLWYEKHPTVLVDFSDSPDVFSNINTEEQRSIMEQKQQDS